MKKQTHLWLLPGLTRTSSGCDSSLVQ